MQTYNILPKDTCQTENRIPLSNGLFATVDAEDFDRISALGPWYCQEQALKSGNVLRYAFRRIKIDGWWTIRLMHHDVLNWTPDPSQDAEVDHANHDGLDNRRRNLRIVTHRENSWNHRRPKTSRFIGVSWHKSAKRWYAQAYLNGQKRSLGLYFDEKAARDAYLTAVTGV